MVGKVLGHYRIVEKIGAGGMGEVYCAHDELLDRRVAIKVLPARAFSDPTARARLLREARAAAALNHPYICTVYEAGEAEGEAYVAMELLEGQPLSVRLMSGALPAEQVLRYGLQLAEALTHAHSRGVIHRDLKSANVIITADGRAKVLDFGLAKRLSADELTQATTESQVSLTDPGAVLGTLAYMAPEQLRGQPADARSDVWALGVVLYEMPAGARPFRGQTRFEVSAAILGQSPPPLSPAVPDAVQAVIERCLEKEPAVRYQRVAELQGALDAIQAGTATSAAVSRSRLGRRAWRHLDTCQFLTYLHARPPWVRCPDHGVRQVRLPWAEPHARFTALFERLAIDVLKATDVRGATRILRISWDEAWHLMERAVRRGQQAKVARVPTRLGVDEKAAAKGQQSLTIVCDIDAGTVEYIADDRQQSSLDGSFTQWSEAERTGIAAIAMDMWEPYVQSVLAHVPGGAEKMVFDKFHIMSHVGKAVDTVRKQEHRALRDEGDESLTGTKYLWLYRGRNVPDKHEERLTGLLQRPLQTARAWMIKETLNDIWHYHRVGWARVLWRRWYFWATHSRLAPIVKAAKTIQRHLPNVLTYFTHRITNAVAEGLNSKIQTIKKMAYGFRNREHFKTAIFFHCGGLQLYPATHGNPGRTEIN